LAFLSHSFDITLNVIRIGFAVSLLDNFFGKRVQKLAPKEILSEKYDAPSSIKEMLALELSGLDTGKHFDGDYVLKFDKLKEDLTTCRNLKNADEISKTTILNKATNAIFDVVTASSREVIEEINGKVGLFLNKTIQALETEPSLNRLEKEINTFLAGLHKELYGWP